MREVAFYDTKPYDRASFEALDCAYTFRFLETKLNARTASLAQGCEAVCAFVNDELDAECIERLYDFGVRVIVMRCAGYSNVDFTKAYGKIHVLRVPAYSPHAVAEHAMALLLTLNRRTHRAYNRVREHNFNIAGLTGVDLYQKTVGVIGTGKIGRAFLDICRGFGMRLLAYDPYPIKDADFEYVSLDTLFAQSDVISLHCPLTRENHRLLSSDAFGKMKEGVFVINTSRGALIDTQALISALNSGKVRGAGLDVYEEEADFFFEDHSELILKDDALALLISKPNVLLTSHQAFLTEEALAEIARTTVTNLDDFFSGAPLKNEVCYRCETGCVEECRDVRKKPRCF